MVPNPPGTQEPWVQSVDRRLAGGCNDQVAWFRRRQRRRRARIRLHRKGRGASAFAASPSWPFRPGRRRSPTGARAGGDCLAQALKGPRPPAPPWAEVRGLQAATARPPRSPASTACMRSNATRTPRRDRRGDPRPQPAPSIESRRTTELPDLRSWLPRPASRPPAVPPSRPAAVPAPVPHRRDRRGRRAGRRAGPRADGGTRRAGRYRHCSVWGPALLSLGSGTAQFGVRHCSVWGPALLSLGSGTAQFGVRHCSVWGPVFLLEIVASL